MSRSQSQIIVIEDDMIIRDGLSEFLQTEGFQVVTAKNGQEGLALIREQSGPFFVLLDLQMPVMTGQQLLDVLASEPSFKVCSLPILVLTARGESFEHPGIIGTLRKPLDLDRLLEEVRKYCE